MVCFISSGFIYLRFCGENEMMLIIEEWNRLIISRFWQKKYYYTAIIYKWNGFDLGVKMKHFWI